MPKHISTLTLALGTLLMLTAVSHSTAVAEDHPPDAATVCEAALGPMREVQATLRQGQSLTTDQEATWRTWNRHCRHASWQQALAEGLPPVQREPQRSLAEQRTSADTQMRLAQERDRAKHPWREHLGALAQGLERAANTPITTCRTTRAQRGNRVGYYTTCNTY